MKTYRRESDNFEVQDAKDRPIEWAVETYGGEFVEVVPPAPPTQDEINAQNRLLEIEIDNEQKRKDFVDALIAGDTDTQESIKSAVLANKSEKSVIEMRLI